MRRTTLYARLVGCLLFVFALAETNGCGPAARPPNPILEDYLDHLHEVEAKIQTKTSPTPAEYFELGLAREQVWNIYLARSRYTAVSFKDCCNAEENRRRAEALLPQVFDAYERAMKDSQDPPVAANAKTRLVLMYSQIPDLDKEIAVLRRILEEHGKLNAPSVFGTAGTPQYYCYYTLFGVYKQQGKREPAIDALARAMLAIDAGEKSGVNVGEISGYLLGQLIDYEPRIVLPRYQRFLPSSIDELTDPPLSRRTGPPKALEKIFRNFREAARNRITLTVEHVDNNGLLVNYEIAFPDYLDIIKEWEKLKEGPHIFFADDLSCLKPAFKLSFTALSAQDGFGTDKNADAVIAQFVSTPTLVFDENGRSTGKIILSWTEKTPIQMSFYLTAKIVPAIIRRGPYVPPHDFYTEPVEVKREYRQ
ncbi:MAG: hypothetical protein HZA50_05305 [Planctomycetes bacterium]|nr:hypothetical protein [Planctomycetota bacterium]